MKYGVRNDTAEAQIQELWQQIFALKQKVRDLQSARDPQPVDDFELTDASGRRRLSELFGDKDRMVLVHNMGFSCPYCTMWADGINGLAATLQQRLAFYIVSPETPEQQAKGKAARGWTLPMLSSQDSSFTQALGFQVEMDGQTHYLPGASSFVKGPDGQPRLLNQTPFGPGDDYCAVFPLADLAGITMG